MNIFQARNYPPNALDKPNTSIDERNNKTNIAYLSLGSNKADTITEKIQFVEKAIESLKANNAIQIKAISSLYETKAIGLKEANPKNFINAVCRIETQLSPYQLLEACKQVEQKLGRKNEEKGLLQSRFIDIDILFFNDLILDNLAEKDLGQELEAVPTPNSLSRGRSKTNLHFEGAEGYYLVDLQIPHPRCCERDFILLPLEEVIESNWIEPRTKSTFKEILSKCQMNSIVEKHIFPNQPLTEQIL